MNLNDFTTEQLINSLPENRPMYKDSGLWQIRTDSMKDVVWQQKANETLRQFIVEYINYVFQHEVEIAKCLHMNLICC